MGKRKKECKTYLLNTTSDQPPLPVPNPLHHQSPPLSGPRRLHLRTHPLIGLDFPRPVKVYRVVQTDHHANGAFGCHESIFGLLYGIQSGLLLCREPAMILRKGSIVENMVPTAETMSSRHGADEPAVGHVSER